jgi:hypothetical protein
MRGLRGLDTGKRTHRDILLCEKYGLVLLLRLHLTLTLSWTLAVAPVYYIAIQTMDLIQLVFLQKPALDSWPSEGGQ